jgi:hypothetical protein
VLQVLTTDEFAQWFGALDEKDAEDVATVLDVIAELGPVRAPRESRESLLWYEHSSVATFQHGRSAAWVLEDWGSFREYVQKILKALESPRFVARLANLPSKEAALVFESIQSLKRSIDPLKRWTLQSHPNAPRGMGDRGEDPRSETRRLYFAALEAAGFSAIDVPAHSLALREVSRRLPTPAFRVLYGVNVENETALVVLGEWLDRSFYGDSVKRAEKTWKQFLDGNLPLVAQAPSR